MPKEPAGPSWGELVLLFLAIGAVFVLTFSHFQAYLPSTAKVADNAGYIDIARAIRVGRFNAITPKLFWGTAYAIDAVSLVCRVSESTALLVLSLLSGLASILLAFRIWGGWIAGYFLVLSMAWIQRVFLCGSEPLFVLLVFAAILLARREKWLWAALCASLATVVRPAGFFALASVGLVLLYRREYKRLAGAVLIGLAVGLAYVFPLWIYFGDPLATYHGYRGDWDSGFPLGLPFRPVIAAVWGTGRPATNLALNLGWICFSVVGLLLMLRKEFRKYAGEHPYEVVFAISYLVFLFSYNSSFWSYAEFPRFVIPVIPILLVAFGQYSPKRRSVIWTLAVVSSVLAAFSSVGIKHILHMI
jgi:hypothetical protein